jgi:hypothetical protein
MQRATITSQFEAIQAKPPSVEELLQTAAQLVERYRLGTSRSFDLTGLHRELIEVLLAGWLSPVSASLVFHHVLGRLPIACRGTLALFLTNSIRSERMTKLAHATLLTLRRSISVEDSEITGDALSRIDAVLSTRGAALRWHGQVLLAADQISASGEEAAVERIEDTPAARIMVVVPEDESGTSSAAILEHVRIQVRCLADETGEKVERLIAANAVQLFQPAALLRMARPVTRLELARRWVRSVGAAIRAPVRLEFGLPRR